MFKFSEMILALVIYLLLPISLKAEEEAESYENEEYNEDEDYPDMLPIAHPYARGTKPNQKKMDPRIRKELDKEVLKPVSALFKKEAADARKDVISMLNNFMDEHKRSFT